MIKAVIVEDEGVASRKLKAMLEAESLEVVAQLKSNKDLKAFLQKGTQPDLYFLDIHLNDGIVFEALGAIEISAPIIFTTAYDEFAIRAFKQNSVDYLLKPIQKEELQRAIAKFRSIYQQNTSPIDLKVINQLLNPTSDNYRSRIKVKIGDRLRSIKMNEVALFYSESKITFIRVEDGRSYPIDQSLEQISEELDPQQFHRVNRSQIVNIDFVSDVITYSNSRLKILLAGAAKVEIVVSRERVKEFKRWLG